MNFDQLDEVFHIGMLEGARFGGKYGFPFIERTDSVPDKLVPFDKAVSARHREGFAHFFLGDKSFLRIWRNPYRYLPILTQLDGAIAPDFSVMWTHPLHLQIESVGRSRTLGSWMQRAGADTIPVARWGMPETYEFAFEAIAPGGTVAVGTTGCMRDPVTRGVFAKGVPELLRRVEPKTLVVYGPLREDVFWPALEAGIAIRHFESDTTLKKNGAV